MSSPVRSVAVRLSLDPASYVAGAARAEQSTLALDRAVSKVGGSTVTNMDKAAKGAAGAETAFGKLNKTAGVLGFTLGGLAGVGATVGAAMSVKWAADYQSGLTRLVTTAGESQKNIGMVGKGLLDLAGQVGIAADELAKGAYIAESAGFHGADALLVMKSAAQGAKQENADLGKVTDAVSTVLHDYHLKASDAATVTSQLVTAVSHGKTNFDELTGSLHSVTPLAAKMNISLADVTGTLAAMTASGESADQATQNMANTLQHMAAPTQGMISELAQLGISTDDLANSLSQKGLAGTLQMVETAIVNHLDPATQRVLLPALNQSKTAVQDLHVMLGQMPPDLAKLSTGLMDGSVSFADYRKAVNDLGGPSLAMGKQFLALYDSSQGFNNVLKAGGPSAQVFTAAMQKAFGTTAALNVALQTTGENAGATNAAIKDIAKASGDAQGNIKGWAEVQGNFNQKLAEAEAGVKSLAIEAGQHLLPVLTGALGWVADTGVPAIEHLGSAVGDAVHWFTQLPAPLKDAALALLAVKLAARSDMFAGLIASGRVLAVGFANDVRNTVATVRVGTGQIAASYAEAAAAARLSASIQGESMASLRVAGVMAGTTAAAKTLAVQGFGAIRSAGQGVVNMLGGPWGVAMIGATTGLALYSSAVQHAKDNTERWADALKQGGTAAQQAQTEMANPSFWDKVQYNLAHLGNTQKVATAQAKDANDALQKQFDSLDRVGRAQDALTKAQSHYNDVAGQYGPASAQAQAAARELQAANQGLTTTQDDVNRATQTHLSLLQQQSDAELGSVNSSLAAMEAQGQLDSAVAQYNLDLDAYNTKTDHGGITTAQLKQEQTGLATQTIQTAQAVAQHAADQAKANGVTDTSIVYQNTLHDTLVGYAAQLTGPVKAAVQQAADATAGATVKTSDFNDVTSKLGLNVAATWPSGTKVVQDATAQQIQALKDLGLHVTTLPGSDPNKPQTIYVTTDTSAAYTGLTDFLKKAQDLGFVGALHGLAPIGHGGMGNNGGLPAGLVPIPGHADGGYTGPGAKYTPAGIVHAGEIVWSQDDIAAHGGVGSVEAMRTARLGYADGGLVFPAEVNPSILSSWNGYLSSLTSFSGTGAGSPFIRILGQAIAASMGFGGQFGAIDYIFSRESGWNPLAQNPTSSAFGIPQFLNGTWAQYGGKTTSAAQQIKDGIEYMVNRYGSPAAAASFWAAHHWYHDGGTVSGTPGANVPAMLQVGETVRTTEQEAAVQAVLRSREVGFTSGSAAPTNITVSLAGAHITGRLELGTDGLMTLVDGRIDSEFGALADSLHYSGS